MLVNKNLSIGNLVILKDFPFEGDGGHGVQGQLFQIPVYVKK
jgi:hypothetical protein